MLDVIAGEIASALIIHIGKTAVDKFWSRKDSPRPAVVNQSGSVAYMNKTADGRTVVPKAISDVRYRPTGTIFGNLYFADTLQESLIGDEIVLVLVIGEDNDQFFLFEADLEHGYQIDLPLGLYSFFVFVLDPTAVDLFDAEIFGMGFPNAYDIDLSGIHTVTLQDYEDIWSMIDTAPVRIASFDPSYLDFIVLNTAEEVDLPRSFSELFQDQNEVFGYTCSRCGTHLTYIICRCGAEIDELACDACGVTSPVSDICPNCFTDITNIRCYRCARLITDLSCPSCGNLIPV